MSLVDNQTQTFLAIFHCVPVAKFWRPSILGHCEIDDSKFFFGTVFVHLVIDIIILALPIIEVRKLQLPLSQRLGIMAMFGFGVFVCVASIIVMVLSIGYDATSVEMPWHVAPIIIWATAEVNLAIVSSTFRCTVPELKLCLTFLQHVSQSSGPSTRSSAVGQSRRMAPRIPQSTPIPIRTRTRFPPRISSLI